jgi:5-methylcytosine-specific restriction endonuclease McrA
MMYACGRCGKIHKVGFKCNAIKREYNGGEERIQRSSYAWTHKSKEIREKANHLCEICRDRGAYTYKGLEVHHIVKVKDDGNGLLDDLNLLCLCTACHKKADRGEIDIEYQRELARKREGM